MITHWRNADKSLPKEGKEVLCWVEETMPDGRRKEYGSVLSRYKGIWVDPLYGNPIGNAWVKKWYAFTRPQAKKTKAL